MYNVYTRTVPGGAVRYKLTFMSAQLSATLPPIGSRIVHDQYEDIAVVIAHGPSNSFLPKRLGKPASEFFRVRFEGKYGAMLGIVNLHLDSIEDVLPPK